MVRFGSESNERPLESFKQRRDITWHSLKDPSCCYREWRAGAGRNISIKYPWNICFSSSLLRSGCQAGLGVARSILITVKDKGAGRAFRQQCEWIIMKGEGRSDYSMGLGRYWPAQRESPGRSCSLEESHEWPCSDPPSPATEPVFGRAWGKSGLGDRKMWQFWRLSVTMLSEGRSDQGTFMAPTVWALWIRVVVVEVVRFVWSSNIFWGKKQQNLLKGCEQFLIWDTGQMVMIIPEMKKI